MKVFLGGTCEGVDWRKIVMDRIHMDYFNPVVDNWTEDCKKREIEERNTSDYVLYVITGGMIGPYAVAEVVDDSNKRPKKTICCILYDTFDAHNPTHVKVVNSLHSVEEMVRRNGATVCNTLNEVIRFLNTR